MIESEYSPQDTPRNRRVDINLALQAAGLGVWQLDIKTNTISWDDQCRQLFGLAEGNSLPYEKAITYIHSDDIPGVEHALHQALDTAGSGNYDHTFRTTGVDDGILRWVRFRGQLYFDDHRTPHLCAGLAQDVTSDVITRKTSEKSQAQLAAVIETAPAAIGLFVGRDLIVEMPNQAFINIVGKGPDIVGKPLREVMPELENQAFLQILDDVYTTGIMYQSFGIQVDILQQGVMTHNFYNITYTPLRDAQGEVYAILDIAIDVTEKIQEQKKIEKSRMALLSLFEQSPIAIAMIHKDDLRFMMANPFYGQLVGRRPDELVGKTLLEAIPELTGQGFDTLLRNVVDTGIPYNAHEQPVEVLRNNQIETIYVDFTYQSQKELDGSTSGIFVIATDVTQQIKTRKSIEEAEAVLRGAVDLAELGTWEIDLKSNILNYSERLKTWFEFEGDEIIDMPKVLEFIRTEDHDRIKESMAHAIKPGTDGLFSVEYTIESPRTGKQRIIKAQGKAMFDEHGDAYKITGSAQDVTQIRKTQLALEQQVQERTEELAAANEELAAINEEYYAINEELSESNSLLVKSNENLQKFAYIASHDLQEPLRKIQAFSDLVIRRHSDALGDGANHLLRIQAAGKRMSNLIKDLLSFSRISIHQEEATPVSLSSVVNTVSSDLEVAVQEAGATIKVDSLPIVRGEESQLEQLFQNLISNSLKFRRSDQPCEISISSKTVSSGDIPAAVIPTRGSSNYYCVEVRDNGVGFSEQYAHRIFEVFQRLHTKEEYEGTGIGLAICERVVANHGGAIAANSQPGEGAVFSIYFPC